MKSVRPDVPISGDIGTCNLKSVRLKTPLYFKNKGGVFRVFGATRRRVALACVECSGEAVSKAWEVEEEEGSNKDPQSESSTLV